MSADGDLIPMADRKSWQEALAKVDHAFGHTWDSCHAMQLTTGFSTYLYRYCARDTYFVCPIAERTYRGETDIVTPYGFSGFAGRGSVPQLLQAWNRFARHRGYVAGYIALNPLLADGAFDGAGGIAHGNELFYLDLSRSEEELLGSMRRNRRRPIRRWQQDGCPLVTGRSELAAFYMQHYAPFMQSRGAAQTFRFTDETLQRLIDSPGAFMLGAAVQGELEAAALFCPSPTIGEAMFSISTGAGGRHADVLMWAGALEFKRRGLRWLSLGGGISRGDGVATLKSGYGGIALRIPVLRQVYDRERFDRLCEAAGVAADEGSGYFPPWHKAAAHVR